MEATARALLWLALVALCVFPSGQAQGHTSCPDRDDFSLPEGSSKVIAANVSALPNILLLCKNGHSPIRLQEILIITKGRIEHVGTASTDCFYMSGNDLAIKNANKVLTGCYQLTYYLNGFCVKQFCLSVLGSWNCSSDSFFLAEGSSEKIVPSLSSNGSVLALYKKVNVSSDWEYILNITDGHPSYFREEYINHFMPSEDGLTLKDATKGLTGEYQLVGEGNKTCVHQFFLNVTGAISDSTFSKTLTLILVPVGVLLLALVCAGSFIYHKKKRRVENRNEYACHVTKVQDSENGFLQHGTEGIEMQETEMDRQTSFP